AFVNWAFVGGTALRFLYGMPRYSEDLAFSLVEKGREDNFTELMNRSKNIFEAEDYNLTVKAKAEKTVKSAFIKFEGLLYEMELSPHRDETISIKVEIDTNPPAGAGFETKVVRRHCLLNLLHYDKSSLLAGKLHALLSRRYVKGRDVYDLMWYLSDRSWPEPNLVLLNNALKQTDWIGKEITSDNWRKETVKRITEYDWDKVITDVRPFVERNQDLRILTKKNLLKLLEGEE
ncbi:MAG: nucleotidyl transferase AbiEii/AbiGii toxin family protein, partial [Sedimentisphaerales bacterium]|nr:nucleotidyl transferase AbiEii/AbiGii toxin family protein [Sedimentisphaerales bacterium]